VKVRGAAFDLYLVTVNLLLRLPGHRFRMWVLRQIGGWRIGEGTIIDRGVGFTARGGVTIGRRCLVNRGVTLDGRGGLTIGDLVNISPEVMCLTADHDPDSATFEGRFRPVEIGSRCWLATRCTVMPGAVLGEGVVVSAGSVVSGKVDDWSIMSGVPAVKVRERDPEAQGSLPSPRRWFH
jgi:maltose O-acetyltransferase